MTIRNVKHQTPDEIKQWLLEAVEKLWPVAGGSLSFRRSPCIRENCAACERGEGHQAHVLYGRRRGKRFSLYVPEDLAGKVEEAIENGRQLEELIMEAGERYTQALKRERESEREPEKQQKQHKSRQRGGRK